MLPDFKKINCLRLVNETGSFSIAAQKLGATQSAVSQQIAKLEQEMGFQLIIRDKPIQLTKQGKVLLSAAKEMLRIYNESIDEISLPELIGRIDFGVPEDFASVLLKEPLIDFVELHPRINLHIECDLTLNLYERFKKGEFDAVLVKLPSLDDFPFGIEVESERLSWVGVKNFELENIKLPLRLVMSPEPCVYRQRAIECLEKNNIEFEVVFSSTSYAGVISAVKAGLGVSVYPQKLINNDDELVVVQGLPKLPSIHVSILRRDKKNEALNNFVKFLKVKI